MRISVCRLTTSPNCSTSSGDPDSPIVPTTSPSMTSGMVTPGRVPTRSRTSSLECAIIRRLRTTSTDASWNCPTRDSSPLPITIPSRR